MIQVLSCSEVEKQNMTEQANVAPILRKRNENDIRINFAIGITTVPVRWGVFVITDMPEIMKYRRISYSISANHRIVSTILSFSRVIFFALPYCSAITIQRRKHYFYYVNIKQNKQTYRITFLYFPLSRDIYFLRFLQLGYFRFSPILWAKGFNIEGR